METKKINVDDLNGVGESTFKLITKTIQDPNPVKFSQACEEIWKKINPETIINYSVSNVPMQTQQGTILIFICTVQYWGSNEEFKSYLEELKRSNLIIKP